MSVVRDVLRPSLLRQPHDFEDLLTVVVLHDVHQLAFTDRRDHGFSKVKRDATAATASAQMNQRQHSSVIGGDEVLDLK
jgi:hypothetical protein